MQPTQLDHIIILVPHSFIASPPQWLTSHFTVTPGGRHADNKTENCLVVLADGVYFEFIAFVDDAPSNRDGHWWGKKSINSIIDWCLTGQSVDGKTLDYEGLVNRMAKVQDRHANKLHGGVLSYNEPVKGGRKRLDGKDVEWFVTFPALSTSTTKKNGDNVASLASTSDEKDQDIEVTRPAGIPFFCHDVTDRNVRVHTDSKETREQCTSHPCGARGIAYVKLEIDQCDVTWYEDVIRAAADSGDGGANNTEKGITIRTVNGNKDVMIDITQCASPGGDDEEGELKGEIVEIGIFVRKGSESAGCELQEGKIKFTFVTE